MNTVVVIIYLIGAVATAIFNIAILAYVAYPLSVLRNALLWPVCLPILIVLWWMEW